VLIADVADRFLEAAENHLKEWSANVQTIVCDVTREEDCSQMSVIDINLTGVFLTVRECAERMIDNNCRGLICLISSTGSLGTAGSNSRSYHGFWSQESAF
jgi:3-oxoacyl-[acyl-carrier protein] reductase